MVKAIEIEELAVKLLSNFLSKSKHAKSLQDPVEIEGKPGYVICPYCLKEIKLGKGGLWNYTENHKLKQACTDKYLQRRRGFNKLPNKKVQPSILQSFSKKVIGA